MFRVVVIHQLILSLLMGPMLCCCTVARLGHESVSTNSGDARPASNLRTCCGDANQSQSDDPTNSHKQSPGNKPQCPCKADHANVVDVVAPDAPSTGVEILNVGSAHTLPILSLVAPHRLPFGGAGSALDRRDQTSFTSTSELLYTHHKLRC